MLYVLFVFLVIAGASNAVNLTDGLDGLAAGSCAIVLLAYTAITITSGQEGLALLSACLVGASVGFLWFNSFPAAIFMGDTGSLGLGAAIGALAVMTQTELLLIILGGIFVIEALSVAIQVFSFKMFRRRVLLMAPVHHHFEMMAWSETKIMLRFWIVAAVCAGIGYTLYQNSIGLSRLNAPRPPALPAARTWSSAGALRARPRRGCWPRAGSEVAGCDSGLAREGGEGSREAGRRSPPGYGWSRAARGRPLPGQEPRRARARRRSIAAARERGVPVVGELELAWRLLPNRFVAVTGTNGKTTVTELLGHVWRTAGEPVAVAGQRRHAARLAGRRGRRRGDGRLRVLELPARGHRGLRARVRGASSTSTPDHLDRHRRLRGLPARQAADLRQPGQRRRRRLQRRRAGACAASTSAAARGGSPSAAAPTPTARSRSPRA